MASSGELLKVIAGSLGLPFETAREHLRNMRRREGTIPFKGYGRGAAAMGPLEAAKMLLVCAGSTFVKDSLTTLDGFSRLQPVPQENRPPLRPDQHGKTPLQDELAQMIADIRDGRLGDDTAYERTGTGNGLVLISAVGNSDEVPRVAVLRRFGKTETGSRIFSKPGWTLRRLGFDIDLTGVGLVQRRQVAAWVLAEIARSL